MNEYIVLESKNISQLNNNKNNIYDNDEFNFKNIIKFKFNDELLIPVDILNTATQIMICISGWEMDNNEKSEVFKYILNERNLESIDYYIYKWNKNINMNSIENTAKIYGKLLAEFSYSNYFFHI